MSKPLSEDKLLILAQHAVLFGFDEQDPVHLKELAQFADVRYEQGEPIMLDDDYDALRQYLNRSADADDDYVDAVGAIQYGEAVTLPHQMGSLTQMYSDDDIAKWKATHGLEPDDLAVLTNKKDGMSGMIRFNNAGELFAGFSRGDGFEGQDLLRHLVKLAEHGRMPKLARPNLDVRVELIISKANFEIVKKLVFRSDGKPYKNPRNMIAGVMRSQERSDDVVYNYIDVIAYHIWTDLPMSKIDQLENLEQIGFKIPQYTVLNLSKMTDEYLREYITVCREMSPYEIDGVVIDINDPELRRRMCPSTDTLNPEFARKYKEADASNMAIATVASIDIRVSKHGYLKPRAVFEPVELLGVTVTHATAFNAKFIFENRIGPGAKVRITRSGDVIPYIQDVIEPSDIMDHESWYSNQMSAIGDWTYTETGVDAVLVSGHPDVDVRNMLHFAVTMDIDGLREGSIRKLYEAGVTNVAELIKADRSVFADELGSVGPGVYDNMHLRLKSAKLVNIMAASSCMPRGIQRRKLQTLYDVYGEDMAKGLTLQQIVQVGSFQKMAAPTASGIARFAQWFEQVSPYINVVAPLVITDGMLSGRTYVFTGFRNATLKTKLESLGAVVVDSFSKKVTHVVTADPNSTSSKLKKARDLGIPIMTMPQVLAELDQ